MSDSRYPNPLESWQWYREPFAPQVFNLCRQIISGGIRPADGARAIDDLLSSANPWFSDFGHEDFKSFARLAGVTSHLPVGTARRHWADDAIRDREPELSAIEEKYRDEVLAEAQRVLTYATKV
jgi:hypothetical protein